MSTVFTSLYCDVLDRMDEFLKAHSTAPGVSQQTKRACVETALRTVVNYKDWQCLKQIYRVPLQAAQNTGTVAYSAAGGAQPYEVTLTGATWPSWATAGELRIGDVVNCQIDQVIDGTHLTLKPPLIPANDYAAGTPYVLGKSWYDLPPEFVALWVPANKNAWFIGQYIPIEQWFILDKYQSMTNQPMYWTIGPIWNKYNVKGIGVYPWPGTTEEYDMLIQIRPRRMNISGKEPYCIQGKVSVDVSAGTITGTHTTGSSGPGTFTTAFKSIMEGAVIRLSADGTNLPTDTNGSNPYVAQATISDIDETTQVITVQDASVLPAADLTAVRYVVSDPLTLDEGIYDAFMRNCELQLAYFCNLKELATIAQFYREALTRAKMADNSNDQTSVIGRGQPIITRPAYFKTRPWQ